MLFHLQTISGESSVIFRKLAGYLLDRNSELVYKRCKKSGKKVIKLYFFSSFPKNKIFYFSTFLFFLIFLVFLILVTVSAK